MIVEDLIPSYFPAHYQLYVSLYGLCQVHCYCQPFQQLNSPSPSQATSVSHIHCFLFPHAGECLQL